MKTMGDGVMEMARNYANTPVKSTIDMLKVLEINEGLFVPQNGDLNHVANLFSTALSIINKKEVALKAILEQIPETPKLPLSWAIKEIAEKAITGGK